MENVYYNILSTGFNFKKFAVGQVLLLQRVEREGKVRKYGVMAAGRRACMHTLVPSMFFQSPGPELKLCCLATQDPGNLTIMPLHGPHCLI